MKLNLTIDEFRKKYYYVKELKELAKIIGIKNVSSYRKDKLESIIETYLISGILPPKKKKSKINGIKDSDTPLEESRLIVNYTNDKKTKEFILSLAKQKEPGFKKKSGSSYWLNRWREEQIQNEKKITYGDLADQYILLNSPEYKYKRIPSTKMNNFIKDYLKNENNANRADALKEWKKLKLLPIEKTYASWKKHKIKVADNQINKIELFENERASSYNEFVETWIPNYNYFLDLLPKLLSKTEQKNLLAVGCGTGNEIERFTKAPEKWTITGIDPSPEMIKQANEKFQTHSNVTLIESLVSELNIEKKYNAATLLLVLHFFEDNGNKLNLLKTISDRLVSGATFVILDITGNKKQIKQNLQVLKLILPKSLDEEQIDNRLNRVENELFTVCEKRLSGLCQEAGFKQPIRFFQSSIYTGWLTNKR